MTKLTDEDLLAEIDVLNERNMRQKNHCQAQADEIEALHDQVIHMGEIMDRVANALKGVPPACTLHSTHDIAELTAAKIEDIKVLREYLNQCLVMIKTGNHKVVDVDGIIKALAATESKRNRTPTQSAPG